MSGMNKFQHFLEIVWLVVAVFATGAVSYEVYHGNTDRAYKMAAVALIAFAVYMLRRYSRKKRKK